MDENEQYSAREFYYPDKEKKRKCKLSLGRSQKFASGKRQGKQDNQEGIETFLIGQKIKTSKRDQT